MPFRVGLISLPSSTCVNYAINSRAKEPEAITFALVSEVWKPPPKEKFEELGVKDVNPQKFGIASYFS